MFVVQFLGLLGVFRILNSDMASHHEILGSVGIWCDNLHVFIVCRLGVLGVAGGCVFAPSSI